MAPAIEEGQAGQARGHEEPFEGRNASLGNARVLVGLDAVGLEPGGDDSQALQGADEVRIVWSAPRSGRDEARVIPVGKARAARHEREGEPDG